MVHKLSVARYRHWYARLIKLYPKPYRERFGKSMEQTFNDLCREHQAAGKRLFGFVLWTFADTFIGIIKEGVAFMTPMLRKQGTLVIYITTAVATIATALLFKDTEYENTFFYVFAVGLVLGAAWEAYYRVKGKKR